MKFFTFLILGMLTPGALQAFGEERSLPDILSEQDAVALLRGGLYLGDSELDRYDLNGLTAEQEPQESLLERSNRIEKEREEYIKLCLACANGSLVAVQGFAEDSGMGVGYNARVYEGFNEGVNEDSEKRKTSPLVAVAGSFNLLPQKALAVVTYLLEHNADVNEMAGDITPLSAAVNASQTSVLQLLIQRKANLEQENRRGNCFSTPLAQAILERGDPAMVDYLLAAGADMGVITECPYCPSTGWVREHTLNELFSCSKRFIFSDPRKNNERDRQMRNIIEKHGADRFKQLMVTIPCFSKDLVNIVAAYLGFGQPSPFAGSF